MHLAAGVQGWSISLFIWPATTLILKPGEASRVERRARSEPLDDLPGAEIFFVRVGAHQIEVQLIGVHFAEEVAAAGEVFESKNSSSEAMHGFDVALVDVRGRWDAHMLTIAKRFGKFAFEFAAVVSLPDQIAQRYAVAMQMLLDAGSEDRAGGSAALLGESPEQQTAADIAGSVLNGWQVESPGLQPVRGMSFISLASALIC